MAICLIFKYLIHVRLIMNKLRSHFASLFDTAYVKNRVILFVPALFLITGAQITGINENFPAVVMHFTGVVLLFLSFIHPWREIIYYSFLAAGCLGAIFLLHLVTVALSSSHFKRNISEGDMMNIYFLFCLPGIAAGISGIFYSLLKKK